MQEYLVVRGGGIGGADRLCFAVLADYTALTQKQATKFSTQIIVQLTYHWSQTPRGYVQG